MGGAQKPRERALTESNRLDFAVFGAVEDKSWTLISLFLARLGRLDNLELLELLENLGIIPIPTL